MNDRGEGRTSLVNHQQARVFLDPVAARAANADDPWACRETCTGRLSARLESLTSYRIPAGDALALRRDRPSRRAGFQAPLICVEPTQPSPAPPLDQTGEVQPTA